jgi:hypothetical protein
MKIKIPIEISLPAGPEFKIRPKRQFVQFLENRLAAALEHETTSEKIGEALIDFVDQRHKDQIETLRQKVRSLRKGSKTSGKSTDVDSSAADSAPLKPAVKPPTSKSPAVGEPVPKAAPAEGGQKGGDSPFQQG